MARHDLRSSLNQRVRELDPFPVHQVASFPSAQFETPVVLQDERRRFARNLFPVHHRFGTLIPSGYVHGLRVAARNRYEQNDGKGQKTCEAQANVSQGALHIQVAWLRAAVPGQEYRCNSSTKGIFHNILIFNYLGSSLNLTYGQVCIIVPCRTFYGNCFATSESLLQEGIRAF
jgi:hypothetical protein